MGFVISMLARCGLPEGLRRPLACLGTLVAIVALLWLLKGCYDRAVEARYEAKVAAQVEKAARAGANAAASASAQTQTRVENANENARQAAAGSDDPLRAGLDSLRTGTPAHRPAPR